MLQALDNQRKTLEKIVMTDEKELDDALYEMEEVITKQAKARRRLSSEISINVSEHNKNGKRFSDLCNAK